MNAFEQAQALRAQTVILTSHRLDVTLKVKGSLGEASMSEDVYGPILDFLADHKVRTLSQVEEAVKASGVSFEKVVEAALILSAMGHLASAQEESAIQKAKQYTQKLNASICSRARGSNDIVNLASPVTGGGIHVSRFQQLFLLAITSGKQQSSEWAELAWEVLSAQDQRILKEGKALESPEENVMELTEQASAFKEKQLPILKALGIV